MNKITSWDGLAFNGYVYPTDTHHPLALKDGKPCRVNLWPEGAPDPSEVPHAGEVVKHSKTTTTVRNGIPHKSIGGSWMLALNSGFLANLDDIHRIPDAPTVKIGEKTYLVCEAVARCEPLEEVK